MGHPSGTTPGTALPHARPHPVRVRTVRPDGTPVFSADERRGVPPVWTVHLDDRLGRAPLLPVEHRHAHDFHVLVHVERGGADVRVDDRVEALRTGDVLAVAPGHVLGVGTVNPVVGAVWSVAFRPDAVLGPSSGPWTAHPLLAAFPADAVGRFVVPAADRPAWRSWFADLETETEAAPAWGAAEAVTATMTRLLVAAARLAADDARRLPVATADPLVGRVLALVEERYREPVSTGDLARELGYTAGHLTTVVRRRTGRTVLDWLTERRMTEARRLLLETDLPLSAVAARVGYRDPAYLVRRFREAHGVTPERWRRSARAPVG